MEFGAFWHAATANQPEGKVAVFIPDGQEGGSCVFMTPAEAEAHEAAEAAEAAEASAPAEPEPVSAFVNTEFWGE